jgi:opacity protein-like surface antigen
MLRFISPSWLVVVLFGLQSFSALGQSLLDALDTEPTVYPVTATFKDTRVINMQSNETPGAGVLHFVIAHRFGRINEGAYSLWGLDNASMRMGFDYGLTDRWTIGVGRSTFQKTYEASIKGKLFLQKSDNSIPVSVTYYGVIMANGLRWQEPDRENLFSSRLSYVNQLIVTRKINDRTSLAVVPSFIHRNLVDITSKSHDQWTLGLGGRHKLTHRVSVNSEYHFLVNGLDEATTNSLSLGVDIETGGHVFQLHITNSQGMFERAFLTETTGRWLDGDLFFGFNLSRVFS